MVEVGEAYWTIDLLHAFGLAPFGYFVQESKAHLFIVNKVNPAEANVLHMGVEINGATRWIEIFGITFQPSELAKLTLIIVVSDLLSRIKTQEDQRIYFGIAIGITLVICGIIFIGNLSTAVLLGGIVILLAILAGVHIKYWGSLIAAMLVFLICGYFYINEAYIKKGIKMEDGHILERAITWVGRVNDMLEERNTSDAEFRITDDNYQRSHALIAVARGGKLAAIPFPP